MTSCKVNLIGRVEFGHVLVVAGKIAKDCNNFNVNLTSENEKEVGLTIFANVRTSQIVLNSFLNSSWRESIKFENVSALESDNAFKFYILAADDSLHIALNDKHLCKYPLQTKTVNIKSVNVSGELEKITQIDHRKIFPIPWPPVFDDLTSTAFSSDSPYQFTPGSVIVIKMKVTGSPKGSFFIRFNEKASKRQLFHFNPRFGEEIIVVNCQNDLLQWLSEEYRHNVFPFEMNKEFQLAIAIGTTCFKIAVNGHHLLSYDFKIVRQSVPKSFTGHHHIFDKLTGFKMFALEGMKMEVSFVDHIQTKEDLTFYEIFSNQSYGKQEYLVERLNQ